VRAQEAFDELVRDGVWPFLEQRGFMRSRFTFHRKAGPNWQVINLQKRASSDASRVTFTANLGVALDRLRTGSYDWRPGRRPAEYRCHLRERIGYLLREEDTWWEVSADSNIVALGETITLVLELYGIPWLDARSSDGALVALVCDPAALRAEDGPDRLRWLARMMDLLGEHDARRAIELESARRHAERIAQGRSGDEAV
jgi:Domain of unknown function (DUF4304)